jgi:hypothetical protein
MTDDEDEYYGLFLEGVGPLFGFVDVKKKKEDQDERDLV